MKTTLLLAEDEFYERESLKHLLHTYFSDQIELVGEARTGREAVDLCLRKEPNVLLLDIEMPELTGLEALEIIRAQASYYPLVLILTAFGSFQYAQKAIPLGVSQYLVKPLSIEDFREGISRAVSETNMKQQQDAEKRGLLNDVESYRATVQQLVIDHAIAGVPLDAQTRSRCGELLGIRDQTYVCLVVEVPAVPELSAKLLAFFERRVRAAGHKTAGRVTASEIVVFVFLSDMRKAETTDMNLVFLRRVVAEFEAEHAISVHLRCSAPSDDIYRLQQSYRDAAPLYQQDRGANADASHPGLHRDLFELEQRICNTVLAGDPESACTELRKLVRIAGETPGNESPPTLNRSLGRVVVLLDREVGSMAHMSLKGLAGHDAIDIINGPTDPLELQMLVESMLRQVCERMTELGEHLRGYAVQSAKNYIEHKLKDGIGASNVADFLGYSCNYASRLFREHTGVGLTRYITVRRIERARHLLVEEGLSVSETAYEVGYHDPNYFSKVFRKEIGVPPTALVGGRRPNPKLRQDKIR